MTIRNQKNVLKIPAKRLRALINDVLRIYQAARRAQVRAAWEVGRRIVEEEQGGDARAEYRSELIKSLSGELTKRHGVGFSVANLFTMRRFYLENKKLQPAVKLTWTNHVELMRVKDGKVRRGLKARAIKEGLKKNEVRKMVSRANRNAHAKPPIALPPLKHPGELILNTYVKSKLNTKTKDGDVLIDCGFFINWPAKKKDLTGVLLTDTPSYTYLATIDRVVDADTLLVLIEVGFGIILHDRLRLRGINAPELSLPEGEKAKRYVVGLLPVGSTIVFKSHRTRADIYGRFVADVFLEKGENDPKKIIAGGTYLNQHLLDKGHAVRMKQ